MEVCPVCGRNSLDLVAHVVWDHMQEPGAINRWRYRCWCGRQEPMPEHMMKHLEREGGATAHFAECALT